MANKPITHKRIPFLYGGKWLFRLRISKHAASRYLKRNENEAVNITSFMNSFAKLLESTTALAKLPKPQAGESYVFFIQETCEVVFVLFTPMIQDKALSKRPVELNVIIETFIVPASKTHFFKIRTSDKDKCITILEDRTIVTGKHNEWFI